MTARTLATTTASILLLGLAVAPRVAFEIDVDAYWIPWQLATAGGRPWGAYDVPNCNYPPVVLYLLSILEAFRGAFGIDPASRANRLLVKLPNLAAIGVGTLALYRAARAGLGERRAAGLAAGWACSANLFVNAAVWGQWDVVLALSLLLATLAFARGSYGWAGAWVGVALATKVQAIFAGPVFAVALMTVPAATAGRASRTAIARAMLGGVAALACCFAPVAAAGRLPAALHVYAASVDTFPSRTVGAWNVWWAANLVDTRLRGVPPAAADRDDRPVLATAPAVTSKRLGQAMFAVCLAGVLIVLARRRRVVDLVAALPIAGVAMFMLCTQMHGRYVGPPAALMTLWLLLGRAWRVQFVYWTLAAALNALAQLYVGRYLVAEPSRWVHAPLGAAFMLSNGLMFAWLIVLFVRGRGLSDDGEDPIAHAVAPAGRVT